VLIAVVVWILTSSHRKVRGVQKNLFRVSLGMWVLVTAHLGLEMQQVTRGDDAPVYNLQAQAAIIAVLIAIGDSILIWRVWVVWGRNYWIAVPSFFMAMVTLALSMAGTANITNISWAFLVPKFSKAVSCMIVANTVISTTLIVARVLYIQHSTRGISSRPHRGPYTGAMLLMAESGAVWTLCQILSLVLGQIHNAGVSTVLDLQVPLIGIMPTTILLLVHFDLVPGSHVKDEYMSTMKSGFQTASSARTESNPARVSQLRVSMPRETPDSVELSPWKVANASQATLNNLAMKPEAEDGLQEL